MLSRAALAGLGLTFLTFGSEPEVLPGQMPRVPATEPGRAAATFTLRPGFRAELVAAEPLVTSPVAVAVDELGRAYVVEMRDYSERRPERLGRVRRLEDTDGDGRYDKATVFLDNLPWPTAVTCWEGGVFLGATPDVLYAKDTDGDGVADVREVVFTGFASDYAPYATNKLNVQALMNSFQWGPDNRIHGSASLSGGKVTLVDTPFTRAWRERWAGRLASLGVTAIPAPSGAVNLRGRDFSLDPRTLELRVEPGGGQHGMSFDGQGRKFVCSNSDHLQQVAYNDLAAPANPFHDLPSPRFSIAADGPAAEVFRRSPDEPWRVLRTRWRVAGLVEGPIEGGGRPSGYFTGATGVTIYRGDAYGQGYEGDSFVADCGSNLVHRKRLRLGPDGIVLRGERAADETRSEFLASSDNWFRPVQMYNAPDGCLWVIDMYREVIEHPWSLPENLKNQLDLDSGRERGRLWRLAPDGHGRLRNGRELGGRSPQELAAALDDRNGWHADTAARLLVETAGPACLPSVRQVAASGTPEARRRAIAVLASLGGADAEGLTRAVRDDSPLVRAEAVTQWAARISQGERPKVPDSLMALARDPDSRVRMLWALSIASHLGVDRPALLAELIRQGPALVRSAAIQAAGGAEGALWRALSPGAEAPGFADAKAALGELARVIGRRGDDGEVQAVIRSASGWPQGGLRDAIAKALADGLMMERHQALVDRLPQPLPEPFAQAWRLAVHPPAPAPGPKLPPPNPDRLAVVAKYLPSLDLPGKGAEGRRVFNERCSRCHAVAGAGYAVGPDLASVAANGAPRLLVAVIDPNREVAPNFAAWTAELVDEEPVTGILTGESPGSVVLKQAGGVERTLSRARLKSFATDGRSLMPEGLEAGLSLQEMADLLAFLAAPASTR